MAEQKKQAPAQDSTNSSLPEFDPTAVHSPEPGAKAPSRANRGPEQKESVKEPTGNPVYFLLREVGERRMDMPQARMMLREWFRNLSVEQLAEYRRNSEDVIRGLPLIAEALSQEYAALTGRAG